MCGYLSVCVRLCECGQKVAFFFLHFMHEHDILTTIRKCFKYLAELFKGFVFCIRSVWPWGENNNISYIQWNAYDSK